MNAADRFSRCLPVILGYEGGFVNDPADPGGATNKGITLHTFSTFLGRPATIAELKVIPADATAAIYKQGYWDLVRGDDLFAGIDLFCFDSAVNCGPARAARWLQHALGVNEDGQIGPATLRAQADASDHLVIEDMRQQREAHYRSQPTFGHFGGGWINRLTLVSEQAEAWVEKR